MKLSLAVTALPITMEEEEEVEVEVEERVAEEGHTFEAVSFQVADGGIELE